MTVKDIVKRHESWRSRCINLIASENIVSNGVKELLASDLGHRYYEHNFYHGGKYIEELLKYGEDLASKLFRAEHADLKPISGHIAGLSALLFLTKEGDSIAVLDRESGGYPGYTEGYLPDELGLRVEYIDDVSIDKQKAVIVAPSIVIFPPRIEELARACRDNKIPFVYDASHILGLIAGNAIKNPLEDVDIMLGSTHKSFPGPQGGIILTNEQYAKISDFMLWRSIDNAHFNRIAGLIYAMEEMLEFGREYAKQIIVNAKTLAKALDEKGIAVVGREKGYTETHQVLLEHFNDYEEFAMRLEEANIIVDNGFRLGTSEVTRRGMREDEMRYIAELIYKVYDNGNIDMIRKEIEGLASAFNAIHFTFTDS